MGDPAGIGPEIALKAFAKKELYDHCRPVLVGDASVLAYYLKQHPELSLTVNVISEPSEGKYTYGTIDLIDLNIVDMDTFEVGKVSEVGGDAAFQYVKTVIELALAKKIDATVTNPLNKEAMNAAGHHYAGHTEIYADLTGTEKYTMMLADGNLRVVHVSTHVSLREACDRATKQRVLDVIRIADKACKDLGIENPRVAVAGLNPHCGENGLFGQEEILEINPAVEAAKAEGINVYGSLPADTLFSKANGGMYDIVVAMYHDQGHIPLKLLGFVYDQAAQKWEAVEGVNITLNLPIIRTSVDHGTAFDQAGHWTASEASLENAIDYAIRLAENTKQAQI
ncbi:4-hydroxythreonine-4-phosphate dehydrogenase PdxA [Enterococcus sp. DIV0876]|uniref:4-hydroxythreonine-4-phosphate dehydrogenase PdxA n=1 Tax=Enterococcus sp. DIV0876 TaxID=2774633 RepID=UPI003D3015A8